MTRSEFLLILAFILSVPVFAESVFAIQTQEGKFTNHGTAFLYDGYVVSCAHLLHGSTTARIRSGDEWIECALVKADDTADLAFFKPSKEPKPCIIPDGFICLAGYHERLTQEPLKVTAIVKYNEVKMEKGFTHGASGSPIFNDGKLFGMATAYGSGIVSVLPVAIIRDLAPVK